MEDNLELIRKNTSKRVLAVVKCNAYGLGIEEITSFLDKKVDGFVVSDLDEAEKVCSSKPVLILLPKIDYEDLHRIKDNFILTIDNIEMLKKLKNRPYTVHIFVDSGMHRFGIRAQELDEMIRKIKGDYTNITIDGIYTHLNHPRDSKYTRKQIQTFRQCVEKHVNQIPCIHLLNSRGYLKYKDVDFDNHIRIGNLLYGYCGTRHGFKKVFSYKARLVSRTKVGKNKYVGYGNRYKTKKETYVGVVGVGYIHGFNSTRNVKSGLLHNLVRYIHQAIKREALIYLDGKPVDMLGGSSMNFTQIDLDGLEVDQDSIFDIKLSSILADGMIPKEYKY